MSIDAAISDQYNQFSRFPRADSLDSKLFIFYFILFCRNKLAQCAGAGGVWSLTEEPLGRAIMQTMENNNKTTIAAYGGMLKNGIIARMFIALNMIIVCWNMGTLPVCWEVSRHLERGARGDVFAPRSS